MRTSFLDKLFDDPRSIGFGDTDSGGRNTECKRCGKAGLTWEDDNGKWRLLERNGKIHDCHKAVSSDEFEKLA